MSSVSFFASSEAEERWRNHMTRSYSSENKITPSVFLVPDFMRNTMPEAYNPQIVGLGPYHHFRPSLQLMGSRKRAAIKACLKQMGADSNQFIELVHQSLVDESSSSSDSSEDHDAWPSGFEVMIRSCYDRYIDLGEKTLAWILIVDGTFLLHFIFTYLDFKEQKEKHKLYPDAEKLVVDVLMLENQIPIVLLLKIRSFLKLSNIENDTELLNKIYFFCKENSPLEVTSEPVAIDAAYNKNNHLLNFMYQMIMKNYCKDQGNVESQGEGRNPEPGEVEGDGILWIKRLKAFAQEASNQSSEILAHAIEEFNSAVTIARNAGLKVPGNIEKISQILKNLEKTFQLSHNKHVLSGDKIEIPSAVRLFAILKVKFKPLPQGCGIRNIDLKVVDGKKWEFYLPVLCIQANSEVIIRNLIVYEEAIFQQQLQGWTRFRDYVDLMCGLIRSEKDVEILENAKILIIKDGLPRAEIVKICNGIKKSEEQPDERSEVHRTVQNANDHFNKAKLIKFCRGSVKCIAKLLEFLRPFFPLMVLILLGIQSACELYDCRRRPDGGGAALMQNLYWGDSAELEYPQSKLPLPRKVLRYQSI